MPPAICPALWSLCCLCLFAFLFVQRRLMKRPIHSERFNEMLKEGAVQCFIICWWKGQSNSNVLINVQRRLLHGFMIICLLMERTIQFEEPTLIILAQGLLVLQQASDDRKCKNSLKIKISFLQTGWTCLYWKSETSYFLTIDRFLECKDQTAVRYLFCYMLWSSWV